MSKDQLLRFLEITNVNAFILAGIYYIHMMVLNIAENAEIDAIADSC